MLYIKPINEITYHDVVGFCLEGHPEGFILEYKRDFDGLTNDNLAKTIAAFANTYGGILIIGVNAPKGKPIEPFDGFKVDQSVNYEEKIEAVVLSHIKEPVFPEVRVCENEKGSAFIVVRVMESHLTPHRVANNRKIYVRTGQSSMPNEEALWDRIEWLASRRSKSVQLRELLIGEGDRYFCDACKIRNIGIEDKRHYFAILSIRSIPLFPQEPLVPFKDLDKIADQIVFSSKRIGSFPRNMFECDAIQNGIRKREVYGVDKTKPNHGKEIRYTHLTSYGLYLFKRDMGRIEGDGESANVTNKKSIVFPDIIVNLIKFMKSAVLFYQKLGYWGSIQVDVELLNALGVHMHPGYRDEMFFMNDEEIKVPSDHIGWKRIIPFPKMHENLEGILLDIGGDMAWSLGIRSYNEDRIRKFLNET